MPKKRIMAAPEPEPVREIERPQLLNGKSRIKKYKPDSVIRLLVEENPKRKTSGSYHRYKLYTNGMTVQDALDSGITPADLDYDHKKEYIRIVG
jgi:hypothetical protein